MKNSRQKRTAAGLEPQPPVVLRSTTLAVDCWVGGPHAHTHRHRGTHTHIATLPHCHIARSGAGGQPQFPTSFGPQLCPMVEAEVNGFWAAAQRAWAFNPPLRGLVLGTSFWTHALSREKALLGHGTKQISKGTPSFSPGQRADVWQALPRLTRGASQKSRPFFCEARDGALGPFAGPRNPQQSKSTNSGVRESDRWACLFRATCRSHHITRGSIWIKRFERCFRL